MAPMNRYRHSHPGLTREEREVAVRDHMRPWLAQMKAWQAKLGPSTSNPYFLIDDVMRALNKLAEGMTGEALWKPLEPHSTPGER